MDNILIYLDCLNMVAILQRAIICF